MNGYFRFSLGAYRDMIEEVHEQLNHRQRNGMNGIGYQDLFIIFSQIVMKTYRKVDG